MKAFQKPALLLLALAGCTCFAIAGLEPGDEIKLTLRGISAAEHERVNGEYQVSQKGALGNLSDAWKGKEEAVKELLQE